jgi:hypothetical protein
MAGDGGRVPDVSEQRAGCRVSLVSSRMCERGTKGCEVAHADPASVLAALLAENPEATVAAIEALLTTDETAGRAMFGYHHRGSGDFDPDFEWADLDQSARSYWCELALAGVSAACRSLLSKAPKGDGESDEGGNQ